MTPAVGGMGRTTAAPSSAMLKHPRAAGDPGLGLRDKAGKTGLHTSGKSVFHFFSHPPRKTMCPGIPFWDGDTEARCEPGPQGACLHTF